MSDENSWPWVLQEPKQECYDARSWWTKNGLKRSMISNCTVEVKPTTFPEGYPAGINASLGFPAVEVKGVRTCRVPWLKETGENRDDEG